MSEVLSFIRQLPNLEFSFLRIMSNLSSRFVALSTSSREILREESKVSSVIKDCNYFQIQCLKIACRFSIPEKYAFALARQ